MTPAFPNLQAFITGGASGIGKAIAMKLAGEGAHVWVADIDGQASDAVARKLTGQGLAATALHLDVSDAASIEVCAATIRAAGRLDIAVNSAGIAGPSGSIDELAEADFDRVVSINLKGVWLAMRAEIALMRGRGGAIINVSSAVGLVGIAGAAAYVAAKHGVIGLTRAAAIEFASEGIRVNAVCPGVIETPLVSRATSDPALRAALVARHPAGRLGTADNVADAIAWLASPAASFVHGAVIAVDGGWTAA